VLKVGAAKLFHRVNPGSELKLNKKNYTAKEKEDYENQRISTGCD